MSDSIEEQITKFRKKFRTRTFGADKSTKNSWLRKVIDGNPYDIEYFLRSALTAVREATLREVEEAGPKRGLVEVDTLKTLEHGTYAEGWEQCDIIWREAIQKVRGK